MKLVSILTPCYNEEDNVRDLHQQVRDVMATVADRYEYEHLFIDNASQDDTVAILRQIAVEDKRVKVIVNTRNFGHVRSPYHGLLQTRGECVVCIVADLQDPPEMILDFLARWEEGYKIVIGVKKSSQESPLFWVVRKLYYAVVSRLADIELVRNFTGFGLYDRAVVEKLREIGNRHGVVPGVVAIAWPLRNPAVTGAIVGGRGPQQVDGIIPAADFRLSEAEVAELDKFLQQHP